MDYIYTVDLNSYLSSSDLKGSEQCMCTLSNRNVLAFASDCSLYILPLEKPNELIPVNLNNYPCIYLAWSEDGTFLLNICKDGECKLYRIKTNLLNTTEAVFNFRINKDDFICSKAFDKQSKLCLDYTKQESVSYFAKFVQNSFNCLKDLSPFSFKGFLLLTKRGKLHLCMTDLNCVKKQYESFEFDMKLQGSDQQTNSGMEVEQQGKEEVFFELGDFAYESDGSLLVAYTNKDIASSIYIYKVSVKFNADNSALEGSTELLTALNLTTDANMVKTRVLFTSTHMPNTLSIQLTNEQTKQDTIQFWQVTKETYNSPISPSFAWSLAHTLSCDAQLNSLAIPKSEANFKNHTGFENGQWDYKFFLVASYKNGQTGFINTSNFQQTYLSPIPEKANTHILQDTTKKLRLSSNESFVTVDQSFTGLLGVGITNRCNLVAFRQPNFKEFQSNSDQQLITHNLVTLYEYSMVSGIDNWDLIISTNPKFMDLLVKQLELNFTNQPAASVKRAFFSRFYSLVYALSRRSISSSKNQTKSLDLLSRLLLNRSLSVLSHSIQLSLNVDSLVTTFASSSSNYINTSQAVPLINTNLITTNMDYINSQTMPNSPANSFNHVPLKTNLNEYFSEILKLDMSTNVNANELKSSEIIQSILNRKNTTVLVNHQLKHVGQWIIDMTLSLVDAAVPNNTDNDTLGSTLIKDQEFLNEVRKGLLFVKLLFSLNQPNYPMPVLPYRSMGYQKDLLNELFCIVTRLMHKANDKLAPVDDSLTEQCLSVQNDTVSVNLYKKFVNLRHSWFGLSTSSWLKTFQFSVDYLFDEERNSMLYPLFDIVRLIQFSRSANTKQCIRCGNYTESGSNSPAASQVSKVQTSIWIQDLCGDKCLCGGAWVQSPIQ